MTYIMLGENDCGPAALAEVLGRSYEQVIASWPGGWRSSGNGRIGVPNDTPYDHFALLQKLGMPWRIVTDDMILRGECAPGKTVVLLHNPQKPFLAQHWVILAGVSPGVCVSLAMGTGENKTYDANTFKSFYRKGWPNCSYEIGLGAGRLSWWQRFLAYTTGKFI